MEPRNRGFVSLAILLVASFPSLTLTEQFDGMLDSLPADILASLTEGDLMAATGNMAGEILKSDQDKSQGSILDSLSLAQSGGGVGATMKVVQNMMTKSKDEFDAFGGGGMDFMKPGGGGFMGGGGHMGGGMMPMHGGKLLKAAVPLKVPLKKATIKKAVGAKLMAPKLKKVVALKAKPKVYSLKPIVHVVEKPVPVFHKVPVPKKVMVPKFYKVMKPIPFPKIVPVPFKVPVKKIIPKIVKIPKAVPIPKFYPVKKLIPIGIPYPVPKYFKVPIPKPMPYKKYIPIPIPKKVPKFIPFPVKKIIKVPKPYYVPIKVPYITASYMKTPMHVNVPDIKKMPMKFPYPQPMKGGFHQQVDFIETESKPIFKAKDIDSDKDHDKLL